MKKLLTFSAIALLLSCSTTKSTGDKPLYEVLTQQNYGGASIKFYEVLTEEKEIRMLLSDDNLKRKIRPEDIKTSNFIILNMGEQPSGGYSVTVDKVEETADKVVVTVKENKPASGQSATMAITNPYTVVRINSKKQIVINP